LRLRPCAPPKVVRGARPRARFESLRVVEALRRRGRRSRAPGRMDGAQRLLAATRGEIEAITALQKEFQRQVEALLEEHRARIRALMRTRAHQEIEERCLAAQLRLDDLELPDPQARRGER
ncbi:unnamed protein product, partial [Prorocentrum cordatum]